MSRNLFTAFRCLLWAGLLPLASQAAPHPMAGDPASGLESIDTGYTITKVRSATLNSVECIVASSYEGTVMAFDYDGNRLWINELSGYMNHDLWCADLDGDGSDETLTANADGSIYCLNDDGSLRWPTPFRMNEAPMYSVCVVHDNGAPYIACGGFDLNVYYLDTAGQPLKTIESISYGNLKPFGDSPPPPNIHTANFLRPIPQQDGTEKLALAATHNHMQSSGNLYQFAPMADLPAPLSGERITGLKTLGDIHMADPDKDGNIEILLGTSQHINTTDFSIYEPDTDTYTFVDLSRFKNRINRSHYLVVQPRAIPNGNSFQYFLLMGPAIVLIDPDTIGLSAEDLANSAEILDNPYSYNDLWQVTDTQFLIGSSQSGGSCIHILDTSKSGWKDAYENLEPIGKLSSLRARRSELDAEIDSFTRPEHEIDGRERPVVYFLTESLSGSIETLANDLENQSNSIQFFATKSTKKVQYPPSWNRETVVTNQKYRDKRDSRHDYDDPNMDQQGIVNLFAPTIDSTNDGVAYWGGHGNDPLFHSLETRYALVDRAFNNGGRKTVQIFPEMGDFSSDFEWVLDNMFEPFAAYCKPRNSNIFIRSKNIFWMGHIHRKSTQAGSEDHMWDILMSGEFADVFVPSMEETTDKTMELSLAGRMGIWASGAVNSWGTRGARDNPSYDRSRQHANQMLPNHFLTNMVFHISNGAQYINNFPVDQEYMSILWKLIAKGALYVPHRDEILSINPVHLSMTDPDDHFMEDGDNVKWTTYWNEENNAEPFVFSRMNGTWPGAPTTEWDYSNYAAGVKERRLSFISPQPNGLVLITPPQDGIHAIEAPARGKLRDKLHPFYSNIMKEYVTDGRHYLAADSDATFAANGERFEQIKADIKTHANRLPITVTGDVGWVVAQSGPKHLRLTIVDTGYINPKPRTAKVRFQSVTPITIRDVLDNELFTATDNVVDIPIPLGSFRFIEVELNQSIGSGGWSEFVIQKNLSGDPSADFDLDSQTDIEEYVYGGDPLEPTIQGPEPTITINPAGDAATYSYLQLNGSSTGIIVRPEWSINPASGIWRSDWGSLNESSAIDPNFKTMEGQIPFDSSQSLFFRLKFAVE